MAKASVKKAPVGKSKNLGDGMPAKPGLSKLHKGGKTIPTFNASRIDGLGMTKGSGGVKK